MLENEMKMANENEMMSWREVGEYLHCGRNKSMKIVSAVPTTYKIGRTQLVRKSDLDEFLAKNDYGVAINWK